MESSSTRDESVDGTLLPCASCGAELFSRGEDTMAEVEQGQSFGGQQATVEVPAKRCPDCGEVTAL